MSWWHGKMLERSAIMGVVAMAMKDSYEAGDGVWGVEVCRSALSTCTTRRRKGHFCEKNQLRMSL